MGFSESTQYSALIIFSFLLSTCNRNTYFQALNQYFFVFEWKMQEQYNFIAIQMFFKEGMRRWEERVVIVNLIISLIVTEPIGHRPWYIVQCCRHVHLDKGVQQLFRVYRGARSFCGRLLFDILCFAGTNFCN